MHKNIFTRAITGCVASLLCIPLSPSCRKSEDSFLLEDAQAIGEFDRLIEKSRSGDSDAILTLFRMSLKYKINGIQQIEINEMMQGLADGGNSEAALKIFRYYFNNPNKRPEDWRRFLESSFNQGNIEAGFTMLVLDRLKGDKHYNFSKLNLDKTKSLIKKNQKTRGDDAFRGGNLTQHDFDIVFEVRRDSNNWRTDKLLGALSDEAKGILNYYLK